MQVHRAKLAGADQSNPYGTPLCFAREEFCVEVHDISPDPSWYVRAKMRGIATDDLDHLDTIGLPGWPRT
jgi:hypothetical protein